MKFLLPILCSICFGISAADLFKAAAPLVDDAVSAFREGMGKTGSLREALDMPFASELDQVEDDMKDKMSENIRKVLDEVLEKIKERIDHGKEVAKEWLEKVKEYKEELKILGKDIGEKGKDLLAKIKEKAKEGLKKLLERFGLAKRNLDNEFDVLARWKFSEIIEKIKQRILSNESLQKIREYIRNLSTKNPVIGAIKTATEGMKDVDFREFIRSLFEHKRDTRGVKEMWEKMKDKVKEFHEWFKTKFNEGLEKLKDKYGNIKDIAKEIIDHAKDIHGEVAREALEFFRPYKDDLGSLWKQLVDTLKDHINSF